MLTIAVQLMCKLSTQHVHVYEAIVHSMLCSTCIMKKVLYGIVQFKILHRYMRSLQNSFKSKMMTEFQIWIYCCILKHLIHKPNTPGNRNNIIQIHTHTYCKFARKKKKVSEIVLTIYAVIMDIFWQRERIILISLTEKFGISI